MREPKGYRELLERLNEVYPDGELLTVRQAADFLGCSENSVRKYLPKTPLGVSKTTIAVFLSKGG